MTRRSVFDDSRDQPQRIADAAYLACAWCAKPTLRATLSNYGARCFACYEAYCAEPQRAPCAGDKRQAGPRAWAHALRQREESGERLTIVQQSAWRDALHAHAVLDGAKSGAAVPVATISHALRLTGDIPREGDDDMPAFDEELTA